MQIIALGACYFFAVTALDITTNVGTIDDLTSLARIILVGAPAHLAPKLSACIAALSLCLPAGIMGHGTHGNSEVCLAQPQSEALSNS